MASVRALIGLAFAGCIGLLFLVLGCALPPFGIWWPLFVIVFYILTPIPLMIASRYQDEMSSSSACTEFALFTTTGIVISAFGLPIVLACTGIIKLTACLLVCLGNMVSLSTILAYFRVFNEEDDGWAGF